MKAFCTVFKGAHAGGGARHPTRRPPAEVDGIEHQEEIPAGNGDRFEHNSKITKC